MKKQIIYIGVLLFVAGTSIALWMYFKPHRNIRNASADFQVRSEEWMREFSDNDTLAHRRYFEKVVDISGTPLSVNQADTLTQLHFEQEELAFSMSCLLHPEEKTKPVPGSPITIRCFYSGYLQGDPDFELPGDIKCSECIILKP